MRRPSRGRIDRAAVALLPAIALASALGACPLPDAKLRDTATTAGQGGEGGSGGAGGGAGEGGGGASGTAGAGGGVEETFPHRFSVRFGDAGRQEALSVAVDSDDDIVVVGTFRGTLAFGDDVLVAPSNNDEVFVAKLGPTGTPLWAKRFGDGVPDRAFGVAIDGDDNIVVTGTFSGTLMFGETLLSAVTEEMFVAKLDPDGEVVFATQSESLSGGSARGRAVAVDEVGGVYVAGSVQGGSLEVAGVFVGGGGTGVETALVAQLDASGGFVMARRYGVLSARALGLAVSGAGEVVLVGGFQNELSFGGANFNATGLDDLFAARVGLDGQHHWSLAPAASLQQRALAVAVDDAGVAAIAGTLFGGVDFQGDTDPLIVASGERFAGFVARIDAEGTARAAFSFGESLLADTNDAMGLAFDGAGRLIAVGAFDGLFALGESAFESAGGLDVFVAMFDAAGSPLAAAPFGDADQQLAYAVAVDSAGDFIVVGALEGTARFGDEQLVSAGDRDVFVAKLGPPPPAR